MGKEVRPGVPTAGVAGPDLETGCESIRGLAHTRRKRLHLKNPARYILEVRPEVTRRADENESALRPPGTPPFWSQVRSGLAAWAELRLHTEAGVQGEGCRAWRQASWT